MGYVIVETGGKQYKVSQGDTLLVEKIEGEKGSSVKLDRVLLVSDNKKVHIGKPYLPGSHLVCEVLGQVRGEKVTSLKFRRRKGYRRKWGHRQSLTHLKVKETVLAKKVTE